MTRLQDDTIPNFCWDRRWTVRDIRDRLRAATGDEWVRLASWILREAATDDVWAFLKPEDVRDHLIELTPFLGRRKEFWQFIIGTWHEMGKL